MQITPTIHSTEKYFKDHNQNSKTNNKKSTLRFRKQNKRTSLQLADFIVMYLFAYK